jgi:hypothetical protein
MITKTLTAEHAEHAETRDRACEAGCDAGPAFLCVSVSLWFKLFVSATFAPATPKLAFERCERRRALGG